MIWACGYGWHCKYAAEQGATAVLGIDLSEKMIAEAKKRNPDTKITYQIGNLDEYEYPEHKWDVVVSNLVLHYVADLESIYRKIYRTLKPGGEFIFNIEHPIFTAGVKQEWLYDENGSPLYWPVDSYFMEGERKTLFLGCEVEKQHHTLTTILMGLLHCGFVIEAVEEARPPEEMMDISGMSDELRRPMMLLIKAKKIVAQGGNGKRK